MMVSGDPDVVSKITPELEKMTGKLLPFGTDTNKAAGIKLIGNLFLIAMTAGLADTLSMAKSLGISADEVGQLFGAWNPGAMLPMRLKKMTSNTFDQPTWELSMARKDAGLMMIEAKAAGRPLVVIPAIAAEMDNWIRKGYGNNDWTVIAKDVV